MVGQMKFIKSTMGAGKSAHLLISVYNHITTGKKPVLLKPNISSRSFEDNNNVTSRIDGLSRKIDHILKPNETIKKLKVVKEGGTIFVDEAQFLTVHNVEELWKLSVERDVILYGLLTDSNGVLFTGTKRIIELTDKIEHIDHVCFFCGNNSNFTIRKKDDKYVFDLCDTYYIGDSEYTSVCKSCYIEKKEENK